FWVHGLLCSLADSTAAHTTRMQEFSRRLYQEELRRTRWGLSRRGLLGIGAAAAVLVGVLLAGFHSGPALASPEGLVRRAQEVHQLPIDRCYVVPWEAVPGLELLTTPRDTQLWT